MGISDSKHASKCTNCCGWNCPDLSRSKLNSKPIKRTSIKAIKADQLQNLLTEKNCSQASPKKEVSVYINVTSIPRSDTPTQNQEKKSCSPLIQKHRVIMEDFTIVKVLGRGTFGKVYLAQMNDDKKFYAIKALKKKDVMVKQTTDYVLTEKQILQNSFHPFIVRLRYSFQDDSALYLVMDYISGGDLFHQIKRRSHFSEDDARFYLAEIVLALQYLHEKMEIVYRDLKPENVLIAGDGHVRITDFGLAKAARGKHYSFCGTPEYLAPEIILQTGHTQSVDWWCLGCLMYEMMMGYPPYNSSNKSNLYNDILVKSPNLSINFSEEARDLIAKLMDKNPGYRLGSKGAEEVKQHPFFEGIKWDDLLMKKIIPPYIPNEVNKPPQQKNDSEELEASPEISQPKLKERNNITREEKNNRIKTHVIEDKLHETTQDESEYSLARV